jgi:exonuclease SbcC
MIPQRVYLKGFLSFREAQELRFQGSSLWLLAGPNGSGKSAVFDGITYALFGQHRGGKQNARELINKDSDGLVVEFDFLLEGELYRIRRTLRRATNRSTRQISRSICTNDSPRAECFEPVADASSEDGFNRWVKDKLGLNFETFTSSVLLLQGKADKLLAADPVERFRVLAGIVDLSPYQRLQERLESRRKMFETKLDMLGGQLQLSVETHPNEEQRILARNQGAEAVFQKAREEVSRLDRVANQCQHWNTLGEQRQDLRGECELLETRMQDANTVERDWQRLAELRNTLPQLDAYLGARERMAQLGETIPAWTHKRNDVAKALSQLDSRMNKAHLALSRRRKAMTVLDNEVRRVQTWLTSLAGEVERQSLRKGQEGELEELFRQFATLPVDAEREYALALHDVEEARLLQVALPLLDRLGQERQALLEARNCGLRSSEQLETTRERINELTERGAQLERPRGDSRLLLEQARLDLGHAQARLEQATQSLEETRTLQGAQRCRHCGQALTPTHLQAEIQERDSVRRRASEEVRIAIAQVREISQRAKEAEESWGRVAQEIENLKSTMGELERDIQTVERASAHHHRFCVELIEALPAAFEARFGVNGSRAPSSFPSEPEVEQYRQRLRQLGDATNRLARAEEQTTERASLRIRIETLQAQLAVTGSARNGCAQAESETASARQRKFEEKLHSLRLKVTATEEEVVSLEQERRDAEMQFQEYEQRLCEQKARQEEVKRILEEARTLFSSAWQERLEQLNRRELDELVAEKAALEQLGADSRFEDLATARIRLAGLQDRLSQVEREMQSIPLEARRDPAGLALERERSLTAFRNGERELAEARHEERRLHERRQQRLTLEDEIRQADRQAMLHRRLAEHLGRRGLQLHLIRRAERAIIDLANGVLDRLSAGTLCLRLRGQGNGLGEQALDMEAYDHPSGRAFLLPFLSGSQRFRVAVSLALGIGQFVRQGQRPIESVIIDEGFGCLDREGRQIMIHELNNLRHHLKCVLLVSHQEEFADAFDHGYRFQLQEACTMVRRFDR